VSELRLIVMPYELGRLREGLGRGPERLLESGAERALGAHGRNVRTEVLQIGRTYSSEVNTSFDLIGQVSERVRSALDEGAFPVVLSGSCFAAVGVVAGLGERAPGVVWFDAHGDFNTPDSTVFGYFDGMGLTILTGGAWRAMRAAVPGDDPIPETAVVLAGARDFDEAEQERLEESQITHVPAERLDSPDALMEAVERLGASGLYLHIDLDVLDKDEVRVNVYSAPGGPSSKQLEARVAELLDRFPVRAVSLTAYDPECDPEDGVPPVALRLLGLVARSVENSPPEVI
jgi:arginase